MPKIAYIDKNFRQSTLHTITIANGIIEEYVAQGYDLTLRQAYYQMVARGHIENSLKSYKNFGNIIDDARLAGLIDWLHIVDRTRNLQSNGHFADPSDIMKAVVHSYKNDKWENQPHRVEVWIEKDALSGVIAPVCRRLDVAYFACRGYTSQSEMWSAARRMQRYLDRGQVPIILYLGDHDPSGIDMTRDTIDRLKLFMGGLTVDRLALNFNQVEEYQPPPNPAKLEDTRADAYIARFGMQSWELDALEPTMIAGLIEGAVSRFRDDDLWREAEAQEREGLELLQQASERWGDVAEFLSDTLSLSKGEV